MNTNVLWGKKKSRRKRLEKNRSLEEQFYGCTQQWCQAEVNLRAWSAFDGSNRTVNKNVSKAIWTICGKESSMTGENDLNGRKT